MQFSHSVFFCICLEGVTCAWLAACVLAETARSHLAVSHCAESGWAGRSWGKQRDTQHDWLCQKLKVCHVDKISLVALKIKNQSITNWNDFTLVLELYD